MSGIAAKGVLITMSNVGNLSNWWQDFFALESKDRVLLFSSLSFIMSLRQWVPTLCSGAKLVIPASSVSFEPAILQHSKSRSMYEVVIHSCANLSDFKHRLISLFHVANRCQQTCLHAVSVGCTRYEPGQICRCRPGCWRGAPAGYNEDLEQNIKETLHWTGSDGTLRSWIVWRI